MGPGAQLGLTCGAAARRRLPSIRVQGPRPLNSPAPRVTRVPAPRATASAGSPRAPGLRGSCLGEPARGQPGPPGSRTAGLGYGREGSASRAAAAAHDATRRTGVCPRSLSARPRHLLSPAARRRPVLGLSPLAPDCGKRTQRHFCRVSAGRERSASKTPSSLFLDALSAFPSSAHFPFAGRTPEAGRGGGRHPCPVGFLQPDPQLPPGPPFFSSLFFLSFSFAHQAESG